MSMIYKRTAGFKKQSIPECVAPTHREREEPLDDAGKSRGRKRSSLLSDIDRPATDDGVGVRRRAGDDDDDDSALFNPTENWLLSEVAAADRCTTTTTAAAAATAPFTDPQELNYYSTTRQRNHIPTFESSCNTNTGTFEKCANFGPQFSGETLFEDMSVAMLFNNSNNIPTPTTTTNNNNQNLNFKNRNLLYVGSQLPTKSVPYRNIYGSEESGLPFSGILSSSSSTTAQPGPIMSDTRVQQFKQNTTGQCNSQICNNIFPGPTDGNCIAYDTIDESTRKMKRMKLSRSPSNFSRFPVAFPQTIIRDQKVPQLTGKTRPPRRVRPVERDRRLEAKTIVISDDKPSANTNQTKTPTTALCKYSKKDTNIPQMVPFLREGKSVYNFFNDADLRRMVGDLRTQMSIRGLCVFDNFLGVEKAKLVLKDVSNLYKKGCFVNGQLESSTAAPFLDSTRVIRGDVIKWLDGDERDCGNIKHLMERIDAAVMMCGEQMFSGYTIKQRTRAMVACYPGNGTHYLRHIDNPCGNGRVLTCIYYLNLNWDVRTDGGLLRIFPKGIDEVANIEPIFDRVLFFWSDARNPHEVKPAYRKRFAITLWYYDERERLDWQMRRCAEIQTTSSSP